MRLADFILGIFYVFLAVLLFVVQSNMSEFIGLRELLLRWAVIYACFSFFYQSVKSFIDVFND
jgi:hypothetical protein